MKVSLIVVQGKPQGKIIPLSSPRFRIGRGEGCHLRPNNEQISRQHTEVELGEDKVVVRDLGSRNGTYVNNKRLEPKTDHVLKNKDLIQVGPLTFAVSIQGAPAAADSKPSPTDRAIANATSLDELSNDQIDTWIVGDKEPTPDRPSDVYSGDTMTFEAYEAGKSDPEVEDEAEEEDEEDEEDEAEDVDEDEEEIVYDKLDDEDDKAGDDVPEEFVDESNPFYAPKKQGGEAPKAAAKPAPKDSSSAAEDVLKKMLERRRAT